MPTLDRRLNAWRNDLADSTLQGQVKSDRFVDAKIMQITVPVLSLRKKPSVRAPQDCELLFGDRIKTFEIKDNWAWVQNCRDNYVGYCPSSGLAPIVQEVTHQVSVLRTILFPEPDLKSCPLGYLSMTSDVAVSDVSDKFSRIGHAGWVYSDHLSPRMTFDTDFVSTAKKFMGTPYLWGGNNSLGIDCSGLVQISLRRAGIDTLRDTDMQEDSIGENIHFGGDKSKLKHGDLIFWKGHVGFYCEDDTLLHANASDMMVSIAPFDEVCAHILNIENTPITSVRRL